MLLHRLRSRRSRASFPQLSTLHTTSLYTGASISAVAAAALLLFSAAPNAQPGATMNSHGEPPPAIEGELEVFYVDHQDPLQSHPVYFLKTPAGEHLSLHFAAHAPELLSGTRVRVHGARVAGPGRTDLGETAGAVAVQDGETGVEALKPAGSSGGSTTTTTTTTAALPTVLPNTFGEQKTLVILVNFQDKATQPYTLDVARNVVFNTTSNFDLENSFQQTWLTGDVYGWYTIPVSSTVCDTSAIAAYAKQAAAAAGVNLSAYTRQVYAFPNNACSWWGLGTIGGNPSQSWINGSFVLAVVAHEMGHNLGLYHSHSLDCGAAALGASCTASEYGDTVDMMGSSSFAHFNAFQKERLGWLNYGASPAIATVQASGDYWLDPYESGPGVNPKALKILKSVDPTTGRKTWYYVEYRQAIGFDSAFSSNANIRNGVVVRTAAESSGNTSYLLDMTPATVSWNDPALVVGQSFYDPDARVAITPTWMDGGSAIVSVSVEPLPCVPASPTVALSPSQSQWVRAGTAVTYTVSVANKDNAGCGASSFNLQVGVPSGWTAAFAKPVLTLDPIASASTTLTVTSPAAAADGFYVFPVAATNGADASYTASASATVAILSSLDAAVSTNQPSYTFNQTVSMSAQISGHGSPIANAGVTFTVTRSDGSKTTLTATTDGTGSASASLRLNKKDPVGVYQVRADATLNGAITGSGTASFSVK